MMRLFLSSLLVAATLCSVGLAHAQPAPAIETVRTPPPVFNRIPVAAPPMAMPGRVVAPVQPISITLLLGSATLWSGTLNVGGTGGGSRVSINEPVEMAEGCRSGGYDGRSNRQIELSISQVRYSEAAMRYQLRASYVRPATGECGGTRTIALDQSFEWNGGEAKRFDGDGGLRVMLTRR